MSFVTNGVELFVNFVVLADDLENGYKIILPMTITVRNMRNLNGIFTNKLLRINIDLCGKAVYFIDESPGFDIRVVKT